jgi:hypothetical protein
MKRYYYKSKDNTGFLNLKSPLIDENYIQISKEEFEELTKPKEPTSEEKAAQEKAKKIAEYKSYLFKTDYIVLKIAEAQSEGNTDKVTHLRTLYKSELEERKKMRDLLNR